MTQIARWTALAALFIIPFLPLYVASDLFFPFITGKNFAFRILVEIALGAWVVLAVCDRRYRPQFSWLLVVFGVFVAWMAVANIFGVYPEKAFWSNFERMDGWVTLVHVFGFFVVAGTIFRVDELWRKWLFAFVIGAALVCCHAIIQLGGGSEIHQGGVRLTATLGNAIYLAVYLLFAMFFAVLLAIKQQGWVRYALLGFIPIALLMMFFTASRGPLVGLCAGAGGAAILWLILALRGKKDAAIRWGIRGAVGVLAVVVLVVGTLFVVRDTDVVQDNVFLARITSVFNLEKELTVRGTIWGIALKGAQERPILGYGQEGFNRVFNKHFEPSLYEQETWFDRVHNTYLDWLIAGGIPAMLLFIILLVLTGLALLRADGLSREERVILIGALGAYAVQALVVFDNLFSYVPLAALMAIAYGITSTPIQKLEDAPEVHNENLQWGIGFGAVLVVAVVIWLVSVPGLRAANHLIRALSTQPDFSKNMAFFEKALGDGSFATQEIREQLTTFAAKLVRDDVGSKDIQQQFAERAVTEMEAQIREVPGDARFHVQYASALVSAGRTEDATAALDEAIALAPRKQVLYLSRAARLIDLERYDEAHETLAYAYALYPTSQQLAMQVAAALILADNIPEARSILEQSVGTVTPDSDALFFAYYEKKQWNELVGVAEARVTSTGGSPESRLRLAQALAAAGRFAAARDEVAETIAMFPQVRAQGQALLDRLESFR